MNTLAFKILPSETSCDHQVRILIDNEDWLGSDYLGVDPPCFFDQAALTTGGDAIVGRCECGCEGCDDVWVKVVRDGQEVLWTNSCGLQLRFNADDYAELFETSRNDFSWEDTQRTAERLVAGVFKGVIFGDNYGFDWASARVRGGLMTLSFSKDGAQQLLEFAWDGSSPASALGKATLFFRELVEQGRIRKAPVEF